LQDPGPLLVAKVAVMRAGRSFHQLKLRTMVKDAEIDTGPVPAQPDDVRVTRLGALLRRTHIDELPQMLNIVRGDMSFVGPRPERTVFVARHLKGIRDYAKRHAVRPGLAGLAQVYGDYYSTPAQKLRYDLVYIRRRSLGLDVQLFGAAVLIALFGVYPGGRRQRRLHRQRRYERQRWRRAYEALRGERAPERDEGDDQRHSGPEDGDGRQGSPPEDADGRRDSIS
jgi:lipopolysaccharide/colanic/teichoic acid biosynthesis glycosyltransferase